MQHEKSFTFSNLFLCTILSSVMILSSACSGEKETAATAAPQSNNETSESTSQVQTTASVASLLGFEKEDNNGRAFNIMDTSLAEYQYNAETLTGEVVNDAVYEKNRAVEDYLGIKLAVKIEVGGWNERNTFNSKITQAVAAGDDTIDMVSSAMTITLPLARDGVFIEGKQLKYMDLSHPWWIANQYEQFAIAGKVYGFLGDASLSVYKDLNVIFFNKRIWDDNKAGNPYEWVRSGKWVYDKYLEIASSMTRDLNGDGTIDYDNDQISLLCEQVPNGTMMEALDLHIVQVEKDGSITYLGLTDKFAECYEKQGKLMNSVGVGCVSSIDDRSYKSQKYFNNGNVATMVNFLYSTEHLREMEDDYGILPLPKYDEAQDHYITRLGTSTTMIYVPKTQKDTDLCSKTLEALCYYTREIVVPRYYESALKEKYARDEDVAEMLDIIRDGAMTDFESVWSAAVSNNMNNEFRFNGVSPNGGEFTNKIASFFASNGPGYEASIRKLEETFKGLDN